MNASFKSLGIVFSAIASFAFFSCDFSSDSNKKSATANEMEDTIFRKPTPFYDSTTPLRPAVVTQKVIDDSDDPAIWIHPTSLDSSLIIGTDKNADRGGLFVFDLQGKILKEKSVLNMKRVNNVDVAYGLAYPNSLSGGKGKTDIAVCTERDRNMIRVFSLPNMKAIDGGGIEVFIGDSLRLPMGVALYVRPSDQSVFAIVGRKSGPLQGYLHQYELKADERGVVKAKLVRSFGAFSGKKEIESIAVDQKLGYVYYSDEQMGIRKYHADPAKGDQELAIFGVGEFSDDNEGISIYQLNDSVGYILVSDQGSNRFNIYPREGWIDSLNNRKFPHAHPLLASIPFSTLESDGSDVQSVGLPGFEGGIFVAMSTDATFHFYRWKDIAERAGLKIRGENPIR